MSMIQGFAASQGWSSNGVAIGGSVHLVVERVAVGVGLVHLQVVEGVEENWPGMLGRLRQRWIKYRMRDDEGGVCLLGACAVAGDGIVSEVNPMVLAMVPVIKEQFADRLQATNYLTPLHLIADFNDHPNTTEDDVLLVAEKAQIRAQEKVN
jgi:hypothetical protein